MAIQEVQDRRVMALRKTKGVEGIRRFDQAPDFVVPHEFNPKVLIVAKLTGNDGTARDKITRVQHLAEISRRGRRDGGRGFEVIACIAGREFGVRREDMKKLILATEGKVFSLGLMGRLVGESGLRRLAKG